MHSNRNVEKFVLLDFIGIVLKIDFSKMLIIKLSICACNVGLLVFVNSVIITDELK